MRARERITATHEGEARSENEMCWISGGLEKCAFGSPSWLGGSSLRILLRFSCRIYLLLHFVGHSQFTTVTLPELSFGPEQNHHSSRPNACRDKCKKCNWKKNWRTIRANRKYNIFLGNWIAKLPPTRKIHKTIEQMARLWTWIELIGIIETFR